MATKSEQWRLNVLHKVRNWASDRIEALENKVYLRERTPEQDAHSDMIEELCKEAYAAYIRGEDTLPEQSEVVEAIREDMPVSHSEYVFEEWIKQNKAQENSIYG
jgi:hypothetical protein